VSICLSVYGPPRIVKSNFCTSLKAENSRRSVQGITTAVDVSVQQSVLFSFPIVNLFSLDHAVTDHHELTSHSMHATAHPAFDCVDVKKRSSKNLKKR